MGTKNNYVRSATKVSFKFRSRDTLDSRLMLSSGLNFLCWETGPRVWASRYRVHTGWTGLSMIRSVTFCNGEELHGELWMGAASQSSQFRTSHTEVRSPASLRTGHWIYHVKQQRQPRTLLDTKQNPVTLRPRVVNSMSFWLWRRSRLSIVQEIHKGFQWNIYPLRPKAASTNGSISCLPIQLRRNCNSNNQAGTCRFTGARYIYTGIQ